MSETAENPYSRLLCWEVWNFMSIKNGKCEFDDRNIINLKGYNDSGKSAMLTALKVLCTNFRPNKQVDFIQDSEDYFRILATFSDGVQIMRDKYINGQSLYEMYKDGTCVYSTKSQSGQLTKVTDVPQPIADYLGLVSYDDTYLNFRSCFEEQIGVQTKGSENYKMFNTVLKSEEISSASELLNTDRNKLASDINSVEAEITANKNVLGDGQFITEEMINYLLTHDDALSSLELGEVQVNELKRIQFELNSIVIPPSLQTIDESQLIELGNIVGVLSSIEEIKVTPELEQIDLSELNLLTQIKDCIKSLDDISVSPEIAEIDTQQVDTLAILRDTVREINELDEIIKRDDDLLVKVADEVTELEKQLIDLGVKMVRCPNCGSMFSPEEEHTH